MPFYDAHNHLQDEWLTPHLGKIATLLPTLPVRRVIVNGTNEQDWRRVAELAGKFAWVQPSFGLHPWDAGNRTANWLEKLMAQLDAMPAAAVGEIGLDCWILESARPDDPRLTGLRRAPLEEQIDVFRAQLALAASRNLPATIHCLDAWGPLHDILRSTSLPARGFLLHAYNGPQEMVKTFADLGAYFSFNGYFLADRKERQRETFRHIPADRLLVETDAPAMAPPQAWRTHKLPPSPDGSPVNHPGNIDAAYTGLAALRGVIVHELSAQVEKNFLRFFGN